MWKEALQLSMAESSQASIERGQGDTLSSTSSSMPQVDIKAVARACRNSEIPRRCASSHAWKLEQRPINRHCWLVLWMMMYWSQREGEGKGGGKAEGGRRLSCERTLVLFAVPGTLTSLGHCLILTLCAPKLFSFFGNSVLDIVTGL